MKTRFFTLLPPAPATRLAIEAFHLRERRLRAVLAALASSVFVVFCAALCHASEAPGFRGVAAGFAFLHAGAALLYLWLAVQIHRRLRLKTEGLRDE